MKFIEIHVRTFLALIILPIGTVAFYSAKIWWKGVRPTGLGKQRPPKHGAADTFFFANQGKITVLPHMVPLMQALCTLLLDLLSESVGKTLPISYNVIAL